MNPAIARLGALAVIAGATLVTSGGAYLPLGPSGAARTVRFAEQLASVPANGTVLVAFDADLGTYPEVVFVTRRVLDALVTPGRRLAFVSFTPDGRALAVAEMDRLLGESDVTARTVRDLGYRAGAEAALALAVDDVAVASFDLVLVVGGIDLGPRAWIELVLPRIDAGDRPPALAIVPTVLLPETEPYVASGQLAALIDNPRDALAFGAALAEGDAASRGESSSAVRPPSEVAILVGMVAALGVLAVALSRTASQRASARAGTGP